MERSCLFPRRPARILVAARVLRDVADLLELPDPVLAHVLVLIDAAGPRGRRLISAKHRHDVPAPLRRLTIGGEREDGLHGDVWIDAAVPETNLTAADVLEEERANGFAVEGASRVIADASVREEIGKVVPQ